MDYDALVKELKLKYKEVYLTQLNNWMFFWRPLGRQEYKDILDEAGGNQYYFQELIVDKAILYPVNINWSEHVPAGIPAILSEHIVKASGFDNPNAKVAERLESYRAQMQSFEAQAETTVKTAFPEVTWEQMAAWTIDELMFWLSRAEWSLKMRGYNRFDFVRQEESQETQEAPDIKKVASELRSNGIDPMIHFASMLKLKNTVMEYPLIGGTKAWKDEVVLGAIREQIQRLPDR